MHLSTWWHGCFKTTATHRHANESNEYDRNKLKPVLFLTGHTHIRAYATLDPRAISMESGKYLDTVGLLACSTTVLSTSSSS